MNFGDAKLTVSAIVIEDSRNMCGNLHPNSVSRVLFSGLITLLRHPRYSSSLERQVVLENVLYVICESRIR